MNKTITKITVSAILLIGYASTHPMELTTNRRKIQNRTNVLPHKKQLLVKATVNYSKKRSAVVAALKEDTRTSKKIKLSDNELEKKQFPCNYCDKSFTQKYSLSDHMRTHTGEKPFSCPFCEKKFSQRQNLLQHKRIHTGEKPYICMECDKSFTRRTTLKQHERTHTGEKPYVCMECDKGFAHQSTLANHERIHTGEKPYSCKQCDKSFTQKAHLTKHEKIHAREKHTVADDSGVTVGVPITTPVVMATVVSQNMLYKKVT